MKTYVFAFEQQRATPETVFLLGNKGAQLSEMTSIGLPVPFGFTISTDACREFFSAGRKWPNGLTEQVREKLAELEQKTGKKFGSTDNPLLVSVRSGSYVSMPGMMDTVLNLGLNDETVKGLAAQTKNERMAYDSYRRFIHMFADVVLGVKHELFEETLAELKRGAGVKLDTDLGAEQLKQLVERYKALVEEFANQPFPSEPWQQLELAVSAVFNSWHNDRAIKYREINNLRHDAGTGVTIQSMVFGNRGNDSATGVCFTRNPSTGAKEFFGEFLINAQGEDVVAGLRTPQPIAQLEKFIPSAYKELVRIQGLLERHYKDLQDLEFTVEQGKLFMLQTRSGKRTAQAAVKIAVDMVHEKLLTKEEALLLVKADQLDKLLHKQLDPEARKKALVIARGLPASPGAAVGQVVFTAQKAAELHKKDKAAQLILVRTETSPEDIEGMHLAKGILTARGGLTSHAAVVARGMGKCCVAGSNDIQVEEKDKKFKAGDLNVMEGEWISLDGSAGEVYLGQLPVTDPTFSKEFELLMSWADKIRRMKVRANADTPKDAAKAKEFGAQGIGLCRTEHMFFEKDRIKAMREMIIAPDKEGRLKALAKLLPYQKGDFKGLFKEMNNLPVVIRLLDPPLHEFLPKNKKQLADLAYEMDVPYKKLRRVMKSLHEANPMLGHRGCRLGITYPEINEMQCRAIFEAALEAQAEGFKPLPEIEVPLVGFVSELVETRKVIERIAVETGAKGKIHYTIGTMIELPRACVTADEIAPAADFFSFGTNDLTQTTLGFSRDDVGKFVPFFLQQGILAKDPFQTIDKEGVGKLMRICIEKGRAVKPDLEIGICGEHGGEAESVMFCHELGLNYVSCSPFRVPIARLAAAQAVIQEGKAIQQAAAAKTAAQAKKAPVAEAVK